MQALQVSMFSFYERGEWEGDTERVELLNVLAIKVRDVWVWGLAGGGNNPTDHSIGHVRVKKAMQIYIARQESN